MKSFTIKTKGLDSVLRNVEKFAKDKAQAVDKELDTAALNIAQDAKSRAKGSVAAQISANTATPYRKSVGVGSPVGAYVEFGTGAKVFKGSYSFTAPERQFARQFFVSGKGRTGSHPYLFPAFHEEIPKLLKRLRELLRNRTGR